MELIKRKIKIGLMTFLLVYSSFAPAVFAASDDFQVKVKKLLSSKGNKVSLSIRDPEGQELVSVNGAQGLAPASIAKSVSTACSLEVLGPQFEFETLFGYTGKIQGETLEGDLVVRGAGDPSLVIEDLREIVEKLRFIHGLKKITGNLVFDVSYMGKKNLPFAEGFGGDEGRSFTADLTPVPFNQNSFSIWVASDIRDNSKTRATTLPANVVDIDLTNKVKSGRTTEVAVSYDPQKMKATVSGSVGKEAEPKGLYRSVDDPYEYDLKILKRLWEDAGGEWKKPTVQIAPEAVKSQFLWKHSSRPLSKIMMDVNKYSLNLGAELIFLAAGAQKYQGPVSYENSLKLLKECLKSYAIDESSIVLTNGSGLSREALIKTTGHSQFLFQFLQSAYAPEYLSSFGVLGVDGTVKSRLKKYAARARLKTGSLKDVRSIAGYMYSKTHKPYAFSMIQNSVNANAAKELEDDVMTLFLSSF